jgi:hypothetical protein
LPAASPGGLTVMLPVPLAVAPLLIYAGYATGYLPPVRIRWGRGLRQPTRQHRRCQMPQRPAMRWS